MIHFCFPASGINTVDSKAASKTVQILIRWLCQKPADLDLHCFLKYPGATGLGLKFSSVLSAGSLHHFYFGRECGL